jgi:multidrug efflux pump subunit AcrA (membrane-fusion protein)
MDQPGNVKVLPGMAGKTTAASVDLPEERREAGYRVPVTAVFSPGESDQSYVWIIDERSQTVSMREVKTTRLTDSGILVTEGLESGEWIAVAGVNYLKEGQQVNLRVNKDADKGTDS